MSASHVDKGRNRSLPDGSVRCRLTNRDREVIAIIALHGCASRSQLMALGHFGSVSRANRRLRRLFDKKYLRRTQVAVGPCSLETIYLLGPAAVPIAAELAVLDRLELARHSRRQPERAYLEHQLGILAVRISMLDVPDGIQIVQFLTEPECRHEYEVVSRGKRTLRRIIKPDAYFEIRRNRRRWAFFLEFDRGHCSLPQMRGVFERYESYATDGAFHGAYGKDGFGVLVVTTAGDRRITHLATLAKDCDPPVCFAKFADVLSSGFFAKIWKQNGHAPSSVPCSESKRRHPP